MQLLFMILYFCAKVVTFAVLLLVLSLRYIPDRSAFVIIGQSIASFTISLLCLYLHEVYIYPHIFSPLRKFPTITGRRAGWNARLITETPRGTTPLRWFNENPKASLIHSRGKLGQSVLYPVAPDALRDIMSNNCYDFEKPWGLRAFLARALGFGLIASEGSYHKLHRRILTPAFSIIKIRALYPTMWQKVGTLIDCMEHEMQVAGKIEITGWASKYALDIIGRAALSRDFDSLKMRDSHRMAEAMSNFFEPSKALVRLQAWTLACPPWMVERMPLEANKVFERDRPYVRKACGEILDQKLAALETEKADTSKDILTDIVNNVELTREQIIDHMATFIGAGHETTASSITWATHLLTLPENQHYQEILRQEIRSKIPTAYWSDRADFDASEATLQAAFETLPYLNGVCEEVLRLFPTVPSTLREAVRDTTICGIRVPKHTLVVIMPYAINRNPRFWGIEADRMRPERWIDRLPSGQLRANKHGGAMSNYCEATFLHGPRACIGRDFAKAELKCALAAIFGHFEVKRMEGDDGTVKVCGAVSTKPRGGLHVRLYPVPGW